MTAEEPEYWPTRDALLALYGMSEETQAEILRLGRRHAGGARWTPEELMDAILNKVDQGKRCWRKDMPLVKFFVGAMQSLAFSDRRSVRRPGHALRSCPRERRRVERPQRERGGGLTLKTAPGSWKSEMHG